MQPVKFLDIYRY